MATITLKGNTIHTVGTLPAKGSKAPDATLTGPDLKDVALSSISGKRVLNIFPSIDTGVCATSVRTFNKRATEKAGVTVLNVSMDLPFAQSRFCGAEGITNARTFSVFRSDFAQKFGVTIKDGGMAGLCSRAVVVLDGDGTVLYVEQVPEIAQEPNYDAALAALG
ncbi:MAG: thiol peroxidase [Myxococcota bacterium]